MRDGSCFIVGAGAFTSRGMHVKKGDLLIAADGGYEALAKRGTKPHLLLVDMDSISHIPKNVPRLVFPAEKDDTDTSLALKLAYARGYRRFILYGISGSRPDHFYAAMQLMASYSKRGARMSAYLPEGSIHLLHQGTLIIDTLPEGTHISVFCPDGTATGVSIDGLKYPLRGATLTNLSPLGVSNQAMGKKALISVKTGTLMIFIMDGEI